MSIWATRAMYLRFSLRLEMKSNRDKISLDCFPNLRTINMYPLLFVKGERHHVSQTTTLGASPPLILGFHPSKRHAALIASCDQGSIVLAYGLSVRLAMSVCEWEEWCKGRFTPWWLFIAVGEGRGCLEHAACMHAHLHAAA